MYRIKVNKSMLYYLSFFILAMLFIFVAGSLMKSSEKTMLVYSGVIPFNHMELYKYTLMECGPLLCAPVGKYICSYKITNTSLCVLMENQLVCEGGIICYKYDRILRVNKTSSVSEHQSNK